MRRSSARLKTSPSLRSGMLIEGVVVSQLTNGSSRNRQYLAMAAPGPYASYPGAFPVRNTGEFPYAIRQGTPHGPQRFGEPSSLHGSPVAAYGSARSYVAGAGSGLSASRPPDLRGQETIARATELATGFASMLAQTVFSHPFVVMRRQCQVNPKSGKYHLTPFTVFQVMLNVQKHQSFGTYWKGLGSKFLAEGVQIVAERVISEATPFPRELNRHTSIKRIGQHITLKALGFVVATPFIAASFVDSVRSEIASESSSLLECSRMALTRIISWSTTETARMLPIWKIVLPVVFHGLLHYSISSLARYSVVLAAKSDHNSQETEDKPAIQLLYDAYFPDLVGSFAGSMLADIALYPLETIIHRMLVQGTRSIIDNTDTGLGVLPVNTHYSGFFSCLRAILAQEGVAGFYKGFGALLIQYAVHALILRLSHLLYRRIADEWMSSPPLVVLQPGAEYGDAAAAFGRASAVSSSSSSSASSTISPMLTSTASTRSNRSTGGGDSTLGMSDSPAKPFR